MKYIYIYIIFLCVIGQAGKIRTFLHSLFVRVWMKNGLHHELINLLIKS